MNQIQKQWLSAAPWESIVTINKALCQAQKLDPLTNAKGHEAARRLWDAAVPRSMALKDVLDLCRECHELAPFTFNNGNTFAAVGRTLVEDWLQTLPPVESQIIRNTVCHYIVGLIGRKELLQILRHFEQTWRSESAPARTISPVVQLEPQPRA